MFMKLYQTFTHYSRKGNNWQIKKNINNRHLMENDNMMRQERKRDDNEKWMD